jgi:hypothetical protein
MVHGGMPPLPLAPSGADFMADLIVRFSKPADWADSVHVYFWDTRPVATDRA